LLIYLYQKPLPKLATHSAYALAGGVIVQITLGALTLIHHVPVALATLHQFVAILLLSASIVLLYAQSAVKKPA